MKRLSPPRDGGHGSDLTVYRVVDPESAARAFSGEDAVEKGGRWSRPGEAVVYTASSLALAVLEALVHQEEDPGKRRFSCVSARIPRGVSLQRCRRPPAGWTAKPPRSSSKRVGARWLQAGRSAVLAIPSVIVPSEWNYLLDPLHPDFGKIAILSARPFQFDGRLWKRR